MFSVLARPIARLVVNDIMPKVALGINKVLITNIQPTSIGAQVDVSVTGTGPWDGVISFGNGLAISWRGRVLGNLHIGDVEIKGHIGVTFNAQATLEVTDANTITNFVKVLLNEESFQWEISGEKLTVMVSALGMRIQRISLPTKVTTLKGFNGLKNGFTIDSFDLPANDPSGGIRVTIQSAVTNPSQVGIELSSIVLSLYVDDIKIALVSSTSASVTFAPQSTSFLPLAGRLIPQHTPEGLAVVSKIFNNFIHGMDSEVIVRVESAGPTATWFQEGIRSLQFKTSLPNRGKLDIIQSIALEQLKFLFRQATAYDPILSSNATTAVFTFPFAFPVDITSLSSNITVGYHGVPFAKLVIPDAPSVTDIQARVIHLAFSNVPFVLFTNQRSTFDILAAITALGSSLSFTISGTANAVASTAVGILSLTGIEFSVDLAIACLQGLAAEQATMSNLDVNHGYSDRLLITVDTTLYNPGNLTIGMGDVSFAVQFDGETIGSVDLSNMVVQPGIVNYSANVLYSPQSSSQTAAGQMMLENYLQGIASDTIILGSTSSTPIKSLQPALSRIKFFPVTIPALHRNLINTTTIEFPINIVQTGVASASFTLSNPFTASINLLKVTATATFQNLTVGKINVDVSSNPIRASGHSNIISPTLPFDFNLDPLMIIQLITISAREHNVYLGPLTWLFQLVLNNPNFHPPVNTSVNTSTPTYVSGNQFNLAGAILDALKGLQVNLAIYSLLTLDDYITSLSFSQKGVTVITDKTALYLVGAVAAPIAQYLIDGAVLTFSEAVITNISNNGFNLALRGSLTNVGPLDALIEFVEPVTVNWKGHDIATISLPSVCAVANIGVSNYATQGTLVITDQIQFTSFATYSLHNPSFEWTISTSRLRVTALGTIFDNVSLRKTFTLKAFNNLPGVTISDFPPPSYDPAGGITIITDSLIPSPAQIGIDLGTVTFRVSIERTLAAFLTATNLVLPHEGQVTMRFTGRMIPQSGNAFKLIVQRFSERVTVDNITLSVAGESVQPTGTSSPVTWLSDALKTFTLTVTLPSQKFNNISLSDLCLATQSKQKAFAPLSRPPYRRGQSYQ